MTIVYTFLSCLEPTGGLFKAGAVVLSSDNSIATFLETFSTWMSQVALLTLGACAHEGYSTHFVCVCVYVKSLLASFQVYTTNRTYQFVSR